MPKFDVFVPEVWYQGYQIEAETPQEAVEIVFGWSKIPQSHDVIHELDFECDGLDSTKDINVYDEDGACVHKERR